MDTTDPTNGFRSVFAPTDALPRLRAMAEDHAGIEPERIEVLALPRSGQVLITVDQHGRGIDDPCDAVILTAADLANIGAGDGWPGDEPWTWVDIEMALDGSLRALQFVRGDIARPADPFGRIADALQNGRDTTGAAS